MAQRETYNKPEFVDRLSEKGWTKKDASGIVDDFIRTLKEIVVEGNSLSFRGFGVFDVVEVAERKMHMFGDGEMVLPAHNKVNFKPSKLFKDEMKEGRIFDDEE